MPEAEKFCLRWNDFESNISLAFKELREDKDFFDVTLACEENQVQAHKVILSACSPFFRAVLKRNPHQHPLLYLKDVKYEDLQAVLNFMYHGEVNVAQDQLNSFLLVAEDLKVKGLTQGSGDGGGGGGVKGKVNENSSSSSSSNSSKSAVKRTTNSDSSGKEFSGGRAAKLPKLSKMEYSARDVQQQEAGAGGGGDEQGAAGQEELSIVQPAAVKIEAPSLIVDVEQENSQVVEEFSEEPEQGYDYEEGYEEQDFDSSINQQSMEGLSPSVLDLEAHYVSFNGMHKCNHCGHISQNKRLIRIHLEGKHGLSRGYTCDFCNLFLKTFEALRIHKRRKHQYD